MNNPDGKVKVEIMTVKELTTILKKQKQDSEVVIATSDSLLHVTNVEMSTRDTFDGIEDNYVDIKSAPDEPILIIDTY